MKNYKLNYKEKTLKIIINDFRGDMIEDLKSFSELKSYFIDFKEIKIIYEFKQNRNTGYSFPAWTNELLDYFEQKNPIFFKRED